MLNMTTYDTDNSKIIFQSNKVILNHKFGYLIENGRLLSLKETHDTNCEQNHDINYIHDAVNDVKLRTCILNHPPQDYQKVN